MKIQVSSDQDFSTKQLDRLGEEKVHFKMFKAGKIWMFAGIFLLSLGAGTVGVGDVTGHAETSDQPVSTKADATVVAETTSNSTSTPSAAEADGVTAGGTPKATIDQGTKVASSDDASKAKVATTSDTSLSTGSQAAVKDEVTDSTSTPAVTSATNLDNGKTASSAIDEAKSVSPANESAGVTTDSVSQETTTLTDLRTATSDMSAAETKAYVSNYDQSVLVAGSGTLFVVGDSGEIIPIESRVGSVNSDTDTPQPTSADKVYSVTDPGSATDTRGTQIAYLQGFIVRSVQGTGDYTSNTYINTGTVAAPTQTNVTVKREAKVVDGKAIYSPWATSDGTVDWNADGSKVILIPALDEATAARSGYSVKVAKDDAYTSADMDAHIRNSFPNFGGSPAQQGYSSIVTQTAAYTAITYTVDNPGGATDPLGTQASNLTGTVNVVTNYAGDYKPASTTSTVKLSRTASLQNGVVTYSDWTIDGAADSTDDTVLVPELTASDPSVVVNGYTVTVTNGTAFTLGQFKKQGSNNVTLTRTVTYQAKTYSADNPGGASDPAGTQIAYLRGTITHFVQGEGGYTQNTSVGSGTVAAPSRDGVAVKREAKLVNGKVVYSAWTTSDGKVDWNAKGTSVLIPALTKATAARAGYTVTTDPNAQFTSDDFNHYIGTGQPVPGTSYAGMYTQKATYTPNTYTTKQPGGTDAPKGTQAKYLTGTLTVETDGTGDYTGKTSSTVSLSRTASLDVNGNVAYSNWVIDGSTDTNTGDSTVLVPELTTTDPSLAVSGYTVNDLTNGAAYTLGQFKSHSTLGNNGYTATIKRTVNYTANTYGVDNPGGADDPVGTQIAYLRGFISRFVQGAGDYTQNTGIGTGSVAAPLPYDPVVVKREAKVVDGKVVYSPWTTSDGTVDWNANGTEVLIPALTDNTAARAGYTVTTGSSTPFTSNDMNAYIGNNVPKFKATGSNYGDQPGYGATDTQTVTYTKIIYTTEQPGGTDDPAGTQAKDLTGTVNVVTNYTGDYSRPTTTNSILVSRTASLDTQGKLVYGDWTTDGTDTVLVPALTDSDPSVAVKGYTDTVTAGGDAYTSKQFAAAIANTEPSATDKTGYSATVNRTVNYTANTYSVGHPGVDTTDPDGTQIEYLRGFISVWAQAVGDYTYSPKNPKYLDTTVVVKREARLDQNGKVTYSPWTTSDGTVDWNAKGSDEILVPALTEDQVAVEGYDATILTAPVVVDWNKDQPFSVAPFTSDSMNAYIANHTPKYTASGTGIDDQPGYGAADVQTVRYTRLNAANTINPGGPTDDTPTNPNGPTDETPTSPNGTTSETPTTPENGTSVTSTETPVNDDQLTSDTDQDATADSQRDGSTADSPDTKGDGTSQSESVSGGQATTAKTNGEVSITSKQTNGQNELPQTNEKVTPVGATIGLELLGILAAFGFRRKKRDEK